MKWAGETRVKKRNIRLRKEHKETIGKENVLNKVSKINQKKDGIDVYKRQPFGYTENNVAQ